MAQGFPWPLRLRSYLKQMWKLNRQYHQLLQNISPSYKYLPFYQVLKTQIIDDEDRQEMPMESVYIGSVIVDR